MFGRKKQTVTLSRNYTIAFFSPNGSDVSGVAKEFAEYALKLDPAYTSILCELPCLGMPRLAFEYDEQIPKEKSIDQLLVDYERQAVESVDDYIVKDHNIHFIPIFSRIKPDTPTILKLQSNDTLIEIPTYIMRELQGQYRFINLILQGQLIHPMTFFSVRQADVVVITINNSKELPWGYATFTRLVEDYGISRDSIFLHSTTFIPEFKEESLTFKFGDLLKKVSEV